MKVGTMKKVLIINASMRQKTTYSLLKRVEELINEYDVEVVNLKDYKIKPCAGCENCIRGGNCFIEDDAETLFEKLSKADGIIIGTPVYLRQISGYLKVLIDRGCAWYHRSPLVSKPIMFIATTQASGLKPTQKYLKDLSVQWGTINCGFLGRTLFNIDNPIKVKSLNKFKYYMNENNQSSYQPSFKNVIEFNTQKVLAVSVLPVDLEYWQEKGYVNQNYFFKCRMSLLMRIVGQLYYRILSYFINKNKTQTD